MFKPSAIALAALLLLGSGPEPAKASCGHGAGPATGWQVTKIGKADSKAWSGTSDRHTSKKDREAQLDAQYEAANDAFNGYVDKYGSWTPIGPESDAEYESTLEQMNSYRDGVATATQTKSISKKYEAKEFSLED